MANSNQPEGARAAAIRQAQAAAYANHHTHDYLPHTVKSANCWQPHEWVVDAILAASLDYPPAQPEQASGHVAVLIRLRDALPTVGVAGWVHGVTALDAAIAALTAKGDGQTFDDGLALGRAESEYLCGLIEDPKCYQCGARNELEAETMCRPSGDDCPATSWPLERIWELSSPTPPAPGKVEVTEAMVERASSEYERVAVAGSTHEKAWKAALQAALAATTGEGDD